MNPQEKILDQRLDSQGKILGHLSRESGIPETHHKVQVFVQESICTSPLGSQVKHVQRKSPIKCLCSKEYSKERPFN